MLTAQKVKELVKCKACTKSRCIYAERSLTNREMRDLRKNNSQLRLCIWLLNYSRCFSAFRQCVYSTGNALQHSNWMGILHRHKSFHPEKFLCILCTTRSNRSRLKEKIYKSVLPLCEKCKANGKSALKRGGLQTAFANRARGKQKKQKK